jgi:excisionase family DNA binding protein
VTRPTIEPAPGLVGVASQPNGRRNGHGSLPRRLLNLRDAAEYLGRSEWALRELIWKGRIPAVRIDRRIQLDLRDLDALIDANKVREG